MKCEKSNRIEIRMPCKTEYVKILRLASAGAANEAGFDIETIDDVKILVSEVFNCMIQADVVEFKTYIYFESKKLHIDFEVCPEVEILKGANDMTLPILEALAGQVHTEEKNKITLVIE